MEALKTTRRQRMWMYIIMGLLAVMYLMPVVSAIANSLKFGGLDNYKYVLTEKFNGVYFYRYFINSAIVAALSCFGTLLVSSLSGFAFSKMKFIGKHGTFITVLMCLAIPGTSLLMPLLFLLRRLHLYNTLGAIIFPEIILTMPFGILMCKNFFDRLPNELMESADIDGASIFKIYSHIYLPLSKPCLMNLGVLCIMWSLQDFLMPTMFTTKTYLATATVAISTLRGAFGTWGNALGRYNAALVLIAVPSLILLILGQKHLVNGITSGALKD